MCANDTGLEMALESLKRNGFRCKVVNGELRYSYYYEMFKETVKGKISPKNGRYFFSENGALGNQSANTIQEALERVFFSVWIDNPN